MRQKPNRSTQGGGEAPAGLARATALLVGLFVGAVWSGPGLVAAPPLISSLAASPASVLPGGTATITVNATDPDCANAPCTPASGCGMAIDSALTTFSATAGSISIVDAGASGSPYQATAVWTAPTTEGTYAVTVSVYDNGGMMCGGRQTASATLSVTVSATPLPVIDSFTVAPTTVLVGGTATLTVAAHDPLGRALAYQFSSDSGAVQQADSTATQALFTAPQAAGPVTVRCLVTPAGGVAVLASATTQVVLGTPSGTIPSDLRATRVAPLPDGRLGVVDAVAGTFTVLDVYGFVSLRADRLVQPVAAVALGNEFFILDRGTSQVVVLGSTGAVVRSFPVPAIGPNDLAPGAAPGELLVADVSPAKVWVVSSSTGQVLRTFGEGVLSFPASVVAWPGRIAVADPTLGRVVLFDGNGTVLSMLGTADLFVRPQSLAWDATGSRLFVADVYSGEVTALAEDGTVKGVLGGFGTGPGSLVNPADVKVIPGGILAVPVASNGSVALFQVAPSPDVVAAIEVVAAVCAAGGSTSATAIDAGPGATYSWTVDGGSLVAGQGTRTISFLPSSSSVVLGLTVTARGSTVTTSRSVAVVSLAAPVPAANGPLCAGSTLQLTAPDLPGATYLWSGPNGFTSTQQNPAIAGVTSAAEGTYTLIVSSGGCSSPPGTVAVHILPTADAPALTGPHDVEAGESGLVASVPARPGSTWHWSVLNGTLTDGQGSPRITFTAGEPGTLTIVVTETPDSGCTSAEARLSVSVAKDVELWLVAGMALLEGANGTSWRSDLTAFNPDSTVPASISFAFLDASGGGPPGPGDWVDVTLSPRQSVSFENVLSSLFQLSSGTYGAILVRTAGLATAPVLEARTYTFADGKGSYGLSIPAVQLSRGVRQALGTPDDASGVLIGLRETDAFRTNLTLVNMGAAPAVAAVHLTDAAGAALGEPVQVDLPPYAVKQLNRVLTAQPPLGAGAGNPAGAFTARVSLLSGTAVFPFASVIDNGTGDPIVVTPSDRAAATQRLAGIVRTPGTNGTVWRSDVTLENPSLSSRHARVSFSYRNPADGTSQRSTAGKVVDLAPGQSLTWVDFVKEWLGLSDADTASYVDSWVDVAPAPDDPAPTAPLLVLGRTYNDQAAGTAGLQLNPFTAADGVAPLSGASLVLSGLASTATFRTNVALFLAAPGSGAAVATLHVLSSEGFELKTVPVALDSVRDGFVQLNDAALFGDVPGDLSNLTVVVDGVTGDLPVAAYATVVDQVSGDATFVSGKRIPDGSSPR